MAIAELTAPKGAPDHDELLSPATTSGDAGQARASRWWLLGGFIVSLALIIPEQFGRQFVDTKLDLTTDPVSFLGHLLNLWDPNGWFGFIQDQYQGYAFPIAPFFALGHVLAVPAWITERVWIALLITAGFWGVVRLAEALEIGSLPTRLVAGVVYALWPTFTILAGINSAALHPGELLPWILVPLVLGSKGGSTVKAAALSALAVLFVGGVNAADTLDVLLMPALYLLTRQRSPRRQSLTRWWIVCVGLATLWWLIPLVFLSKYGFNFLPYTEQSSVTTSTMSAAAVLSGTGDWVSYLRLGNNLWDPSANALVTLPISIVGAALAAGVGLFGLARRDLRERRFLLLVFAVTVVLTMSAYWGSFGGPFGSLLRPLLNTTLEPFRNVYKFEPLIALPLALGIAHALGLLLPHLKRKRSLVLVSVLTIAGLVGLVAPFLLGKVPTPGSYQSIPKYWYQTADYLDQHAPHTNALILPASVHGIYVWGWTVDEPLESLSKSPWVDREVAPYGGAGSTRVIDAIDQALRTGIPQPGLAELLNRSGISYIVMQNDVEWQLSDSPSPYTINSVLDSSGLSVAASFGPTIKTYAGNNPTLRILTGGYEVPYPTIQIFKVDGSNTPVQTFPTSTAALVTGGPEAGLQLFNQGIIKQNQATILAGDWPGGRYNGPLMAITDTLRRENYQFGLVNDNFSYTLTPNQNVSIVGSPDGLQQPRQMLPFSGANDQTVAQYVGAASVDASSYGSWTLTLPEYNPANVFDNQSATGWAAGSPNGSIGQWLSINFNRPLDARGTTIKLLASGNRPVATEVEVATNRGSLVAHLRPTGARQALPVPAGKADWLKVTFLKVEGASALGGAGIQQISIPGLHVQEYLKPPQAAIGAGAKSTVFSFQTDQVDPSAILRSEPEPVMARTFSTTKSSGFKVTGTAVPIKGTSLDTLLDTSSVHVLASSTFDNLPSLRPANLVDGLLTTDWIADGRHATLTMSWPKPQVLDQVSVVFAQSQLAAKPEEILIKSPFGSRLLHVNVAGGADVIKFKPLDTDRIQISFPSVQNVELPNTLGGVSPNPVGLAELAFPALKQYQVAPQDPAAVFVRLCGAGPTVNIDGHSYATFVWGTYGQLYNLQPLNIQVCNQTPSAADAASKLFTPQTVRLPQGTHYLLTRPSTRTISPFTVDGLTLSQISQKTPSPPVRASSIVMWGSESRTVRVGPGASTYLEVHQNYNTGWAATLNGKKLQPVVLDGWQQGYVVPAGAGGNVQMTYQPEGLYLGGLLIGALGVVLLLVLLALSYRKSSRFAHWAEETAAVASWNKRIPTGLMVAASAVVLFLVGGPAVLLLPVLLLVARYRSRALPWVALSGIVIAGIFSASDIGNGAQSGVGAFGPWAQLAALLSIAAVLTPIIGRPHGSTRTDQTTESDDAGETVAAHESNGLNGSTGTPDSSEMLRSSNISS